MPTKPIVILLIGDSPLDAAFIAKALETRQSEPKYSLLEASSLAAARDFLKNDGVDLVLLDIARIGREVEPVRGLRVDFPHVPLIVLTDTDDDRTALEAVSRGAQDYLVRGAFDSHLLRRAVAYALERHQMLERLERSSEERFRQIIEKSADGMVVIDLGGTVCFINPAVEHIFERHASDIVGQKFDFHMLARRDNGVGESRMDDLSLKYVSLLAKTGKSTEMEISLDGDVVKLVEMRATDIQWELKPAYLVVFHDITSLMRLQRLKAEIFERERISKLKDEFISTVSHELRTPLAIVKCAVENMKDGVTGALSEKQEKIVRIASSNVDRLTKLIDDILDLSRLEAGSVKVSKRMIALDQLIQDTVRRFTLLTGGQNVAIEADLPATLPEVYADNDKITQVLDNLLGNALRFARGRIIIRVRTVSSILADVAHATGELARFHDFISQNAEGVQVSVIDDGPGIAKEKLGQLFNKFVQIDRPSGGAGYKGTGLGLAIAKEIVELHDGKIWVESEPGQGAQFHFILPRYYELHDGQERSVSS